MTEAERIDLLLDEVARLLGELEALHAACWRLLALLPLEELEPEVAARAGAVLFIVELGTP